VTTIEWEIKIIHYLSGRYFSTHGNCNAEEEADNDVSICVMLAAVSFSILVPVVVAVVVVVVFVVVVVVVVGSVDSGSTSMVLFFVLLSDVTGKYLWHPLENVNRRARNKEERKLDDHYV
jgi:hypothetical protein